MRKFENGDLEKITNSVDDSAKLKNLENDLIEALKRFPYQYDKPCGQKEGIRARNTSQIKNLIASVGTKYGLSAWATNLSSESNNRVHSPNCHIQNKEWMYDLILFSYDANVDYAINHLWVVVESEWGASTKSKNTGKIIQYGEVKSDFQKLLIANADIRILIFRKIAYKDYELNKLFEFFKCRINKYSANRDDAVFLFVCYGFKMEKNRTTFTLKKFYKGEFVDITKI